jgi:outer membrane protein
MLAVWTGPAQAQSFTRVFDDLGDAIKNTLTLRPQDVTNISLGVGPAVTPRFEGSREYQIRPVPVFSLRYRDVLRVTNNDIDFTAFDKALGEDGGKLELGPTLNFDFGRSENDSRKLRGLGDVGFSTEVGGYVGYAFGPTALRLEVGQDIAGGHKGALAEFSATTTLFRSDRFGVGASAGVTWASAKYLNSFFGVTATQAAAAGLPQFHAGSTLKNANISLNANYALTPHWALLATLAYERLLGDAAASPLVRLRGAADQGHFSSFVMYTF